MPLPPDLNHMKLDYSESISCRLRFRKRGDGFTLVELLVVMAVVAALAGIGAVVLTASQENARKAEEISIARNLATAYNVATVDRDGILLPGYDRHATDVTNVSGQELTHPVSSRYPFRLLPYLSNTAEGIFYAKGATPKPGDYEISLGPGLGINAYLVGGYFDDSADPDKPEYQADVIGHAARATADQTVLFASSKNPEEEDMGHYLVTPPHFPGANWNEERTGFVDFRHSGAAVVAFLDGHIELMEQEALEDMRLWSYQAAELDDPEYMPRKEKKKPRR